MMRFSIQRLFANLKNLPPDISNKIGVARNFIFFVAVLMLFIYVAYQPNAFPNRQPTPAEPQPPSYAERFFEQLAANFDELIQKALHDPSALAAVATAMFTLVLMVTSIIQGYASLRAARASKMSAEVAEKALTRLERPYVFCTGAMINDAGLLTSVNRQGFTFTLFFSNAGKTPAVITGMGLSCESGKPHVLNRPLIEPPEITNVLVPGTPWHPQFEWSEKRTHELDKIISGEALIFVYGEVTYRDHFGGAHRTGFGLAIRRFGQAAEFGGEAFNFQT